MAAPRKVPQRQSTSAQETFRATANIADVVRMQQIHILDGEEHKNTVWYVRPTSMPTENHPASPPSSPTDVAEQQLDGNKQINHTILEKLTQIRENRQTYERDSIDFHGELPGDGDDFDDFDDIAYRIRKFKDFSRSSKRGSSKALCSFVSVRNLPFPP